MITTKQDVTFALGLIRQFAARERVLADLNKLIEEPKQDQMDHLLWALICLGSFFGQQEDEVAMQAVRTVAERLAAALEKYTS